VHERVQGEYWYSLHWFWTEVSGLPSAAVGRKNEQETGGPRAGVDILEKI